MRNDALTSSFDSIDSEQLTAVTGGCGKKQVPPPPQPQQQAMAPAPRSSGGVDVTVATGAAAQQLIGGGAQQFQSA